MERAAVFLETLTLREQERCNTMGGLFHTLISKFKPQYNEAIKLLQICKLVRQMNENAEEWMGGLQLAAVECNYKEIDRQVNEQFIHGLNYNEMLAEIIREVPKTEENEIMTSKQVLAWARKVGTQRAQSEIINSLSE